MIKQLALGVAAALLAAGAAQAQETNGTFGPTSTGTFTVSAEIEPVVRVSGLNSLDLTAGAAFLNGSNPNVNGRFMYCVYSNVSDAGTYTLELEGDNANGSWILSGDNGTVPFGVNSSDGVTTRFMAPGRSFVFSSAARTGDRPNTADCTDTGENTQIIVAISRADILAANAGEYEATLSVVASAL